MVTVTRGGEIFIGDQPAGMEDLPAAVQAAFVMSPGTGVKIKADQEAAVGILIQVVDGVRLSGCTIFSVVTKNP